MEDLREAAECTPKQPIKDVYHFDTPTGTPTENKQTNQKRSRQKSSGGQQQGRKTMKKTDKKTAGKAEHDQTDKKVRGRNEKDSHLRENNRKRSASLPKTRDAVPDDQSTMTQFYDFDDEIGNAEKGECSGINLSELKSDINTGVDDSVGVEGNVDNIRIDKAEKVKKKRNKAAEVITEICKTTTRLRRKSDTDDHVKTLANDTEFKKTNWFEDGTAMVIDNELDILDNPKPSKVGDCLTENIAVMETETQQGLPDMMPNEIKGNGRKKALKDKVSLKDDSLLAAEHTDLKKPKHAKSRKSKSLPSGETDMKGAKAKVEQPEKTEKESNESTPVKEVASASKLGRKAQSKLPSGRKSVTPKSQKSKPAQQTEVLKVASSSGTHLLPSNKSTPRRSRASGSPAGVSPRTTLSPSNRSTLSPSNRSTPLRSKVSSVPAALSPAFNKRNAKGETPLQVAAIKVHVMISTQTNR